MLFVLFWMSLVSVQNENEQSNSSSSLKSYEQAAILVEKCEYLYLTDIDTLNVLGLASLQLLELPSENTESETFRLETLASTYNVLGFYNSVKGNTKKALEYYHSGIETAESINSRALLDELYNNIAKAYLDIGAHSKSFHFYQQSLMISIQLNDQENIANALDNMSFIFQSQSDLDRTLAYREKALEIREKLSETSGIARSYNNIALVYQIRGDITFAREYYFKSLAVNQKANDLGAISSNYDNIGSSFAEEGQMDSAIVYYNYGLTLAEDLDLPANISGANVSLSMAYRENGQFDKALKYANTAYSIATSINNQRLILYSSSELSLIHEELGNHKEGLYYLRILNTLNDTFNTSRFERKLLLKEEMLKFSIERSAERLEMEKEIALNKSNSERKLWTYLLSAFIILAVILFLLYTSRQKQKLTSSQLKFSDLKKKTLEEELTTKQRELTSISVRVTQNNQYLETVNDIIDGLKGDHSNDLDKKLYDLKRLIKESARIDEDWTNFQKQFDGVYAAFSRTLKEDFPQLTANEIKLCRLMKLNMNSSEIAIFLNVSPNTLRSSRYRIHKKMDLEKGTKLHDFLIKMG